MLNRSHYWVSLALLLPPPVLASEVKEEFLAAARKGDAKTVETLLAKGVEVNTKTEYGVTALMYAADKGHLDVVKVLLKHKADVNAKDNFYGATALTWAAYRGHAKIVQSLLEAGTTGVDRALTMAVPAGRVEVVRILLEKGKVAAATLSSALEMAATPERAEIKQLLLKAGAKPATKTGFQADEKLLRSYAGTYKDAKSAELEITSVRGGLTARLADGPLMVFTATDATTFKTADKDPTTITFQRDGDKVRGLTLKRGTSETKFSLSDPAITVDPVLPKIDDKPVRVVTPRNWPSFRGTNASGVGDGQFPPITWDVKTGHNVRWKTPIAGLGHSCPIVWGDRVFVTTAVSSDPKATLRPGLYGDVDSVSDASRHSWRVYCLDKGTGRILWERTAAEGVPKIKRHMKSTHANP